MNDIMLVRKMTIEITDQYYTGAACDGGKRFSIRTVSAFIEGAEGTRTVLMGEEPNKLVVRDPEVRTIVDAVKAMIYASTQEVKP